MLKMIMIWLALAAVCPVVQAHAACTEYAQAVAALIAAEKLQQEHLHLWRGETEALRARLAEDPPGPGWASFGWSKSMTAGDPGKLLNLLTSAKELGLLGRGDKASRLLLCDIARRYEQAAHSVDDRKTSVAVTLRGLEEMPEYARFMALAGKSWEMQRDAVLCAVEFLKSECGAHGSPNCTRADAQCASTPEFRAFKRRIEHVRMEAEKAARKYGARITDNWPGKLAYLLDDVRYRADLWSMAWIADISESTSTDGLRLVSDLFRIDDDADKLVRDPFRTRVESFPPLYPVEQRLAREALHALDLYNDDFYKRNLTPVVNKAWELWHIR
ncbi:hypothetical protein [Fundidesulfovibrio agrisoli]|uniref:hypothetical protein n=1 Tax=Fundidesulfovibrio agrisoli TaxID=2922717 RepID=UPI001FACFC3A|nr:hypothetical protein [Fundidesulfovibrio agrisoli]